MDRFVSHKVTPRWPIAELTPANVTATSFVWQRGMLGGGGGAPAAAGWVVATGAGLADPVEGAVARCELPVAAARCAGPWLAQAGVRATRNAAALRAPKLRSVNARLRAVVHIVSPYMFCAVYLASPRLITASRWDATMGKGRPPPPGEASPGGELLESITRHEINEGPGHPAGGAARIIGMLTPADR